MPSTRQLKENQAEIRLLRHSFLLYRAKTARPALKKNLSRDSSIWLFLLEHGTTQQDAADKFGTSRSNVRRIKQKLDRNFTRYLGMIKQGKINMYG